MGRPLDTGRYETREELCRHVWEDYRASPPYDRNRTRRIAALNGCSMTTVNKILNNLEGIPPEEPAPAASPEPASPPAPVSDPLAVDIEWVVQELEEGWYTLRTFATEEEAAAYYEGMVHAKYPHPIRMAEQTIRPVKAYAP